MSHTRKEALCWQLVFPSGVQFYQRGKVIRI